MKQRIWLVAVSCVLLAVSLAFFLENRDYLEAPVPTPSHSGGYYDAPFTLTLSCPATGTLYYTTDGSTPTTDSPVYSGGIPISDRSGEPNVYNAVRNIVPDWPEQAVPEALVPKGTVIRALYVSPMGEQSEILTETYFVGLGQPEQGYTLNLVFDFDDLFGEEGIYVTGREYDQWLLSGGVGEAPIPNYLERNEIPVTAQMMKDGQSFLSQAVGLRIQGHSARGLPRKRFVLTAREKYSGKEVFEAPIFDGISSHSVMLKDSPVDAMAYQLAADRDVGVQRSVPVRVYLNGEYWQDTFILERYDKQYFRQHYNVADRLRVKNNQMDEDFLATSPVDIYSEYMYWVRHTDFSDPQEWEALLAETDVQSYIDYICINYFLCNYDFSQWHNCFLWRSASRESSPWADQRWRWCIYDVDAFNTVEFAYPDGPAAEIDIFTCVFPQTDMILNQNDLFLALKQNPAGRQQFVLSFLDIGNNNFAPQRVAPVLEQYGLDLSWKGNYFPERFAYAADYLAKEFNLTGTLETVTVTTADSQMGSVRVNTSVIDLDSGTWTGQYFTDYPITVTAIPQPGYVFTGWRGSTDSTDAQLTIAVDGGVQLEAVFEAR